MEKVTVWTNSFCWGGANEYRDKAVDEVDEALAEGKAVRVGADCIGHTRACMVESSARGYFESIGAVEVDRDWMGVWYMMPTK